jgi:hypothetical protein
MSDDTFEEAELDDIVDDDLDTEDDVDDLVDDVIDDEIVDDALVVVDSTDPAVVEIPTGTKAVDPDAPAEEDEEDVLDLDEELHPDDIEVPLDTLLQERTAKATLDEDEDEVDDYDEVPDERGDGTTKIVPRRPGEFLCQSCFLVLPKNQLADPVKMLCRDCA